LGPEAGRSLNSLAARVEGSSLSLPRISINPRHIRCPEATTLIAPNDGAFQDVGAGSRPGGALPAPTGQDHLLISNR
jgi:hypothetical protein